MPEFRFDPDVPVIVLEVVIEGPRGRRWVTAALGTGATYTLFPREILEAVGYTPRLAEEKTTLITASDVESVPLLTVKRIGLPGLSCDNVKVVCHDLPERSYVNGLLGLSFLRRFQMQLDFASGVLTLLPVP